MPTTHQPLRFAVIGARRGRTFIHSAQGLADQVQLTAVCDIDPDALAEWQGDTAIKCLSDYQQVLNDPDIDAVCIATPVALHAAQALDALNAGKHVLSEVIAAYTLEECWALIEATKRTGLTYMMAENYCYMRENMLIQNMVDLGVFGEITFASGAYLHDCRDLMHYPDGTPTWRGELRRTRYGNTYPTHSVGPVAKWLGINRTDKFATTLTFQTPGRSIASFMQRNMPGHPEATDLDSWKSGDSVTTIVTSQNGRLMDFRFDAFSARPHNMARHELQGTHASYASQENCYESLIWIDGRSPARDNGIPSQWEPISKYYDEFEHPLWKKHREEATKAGHGGGDFFVLREFAEAVREGRLPYIDVYDAATWSSISPLSVTSIDGGNVPVAVPDFIAGRE